MKKFAIPTIGLICLFCLYATIVAADNDKPIQVSRLPQPAQTFIDRYFSGGKLLIAKKETEFMKTTYEVLFSNGDRIEFDRRGDWQTIDCKFSSLPEEAVPAPIVEYLRTHYPEARILKIEKERRKYEVKLSNRLELTFDRRFSLIDIDD